MRFHTLRILTFALAGTLLGASSLPAQTLCGAWDPNLAPAGPDQPFTDFQVFDDGTGPALYAAGPFHAIGGQVIRGVARWDGTQWSQVGSNLAKSSYLAVFDDGDGARLYVTASFPHSPYAETVLRWDGAHWSRIADAFPLYDDLWGPSKYTALEALDDGQSVALFAAGQIGRNGVFESLLRWNGTTWESRSAGLPIPSPATLYALASFDAGNGPQLYAGAATTGLVSRWNGTAWESVGLQGSAYSVFQLLPATLGGSSALYAIGFVVGKGLEGIARYDGTSWSSVYGGVGPAPAMATRAVLHDDGSGPALIVGGPFTEAAYASVPAAGLARWDGVSWSAYGPGFVAPTSTYLSAMASFDDGSGPKLFASGHIRPVGVETTTYAAHLAQGQWTPVARGAGISMKLHSGFGFDDGTGPALYASGQISGAPIGIQRWNGAELESIGAIENTPANSYVHAWATFPVAGHDELFAAGEFQRIDGVSALNIARFDGSSWHPLGTGITASVGSGGVQCLAVFDSGSGPELYAGGSFFAAGSVGTGNIARWNGTNWSAVHGSTGFGVGPGHVYDLLGFDDGSGEKLYAAGNFGGPSMSGIARWDGQVWLAMPSLPFGSPAALRDLIVFDDGTGPNLYATYFTYPGYPIGSPTLARWDGASWSIVPTPGNVVGRCTVIHGNEGPRLCAPMAVGSITHSEIHAFDGQSWSPLSGPISDKFDPFDLFAYDLAADGVPDLWVTGNGAVEGHPFIGFGRFEPCGTQADVVCAGDGSGSACPCAISGASEHGCANSVFASGAALTNGGLASLSHDTLHLDARKVTGSFAIFVQGTAIAGTSGVAFGDGLRCVDGAVLRVASAPITGNAAMVPTQSGTSLSSLGAISLPGSTRIYQVVYRNAVPYCSPEASNATNGICVTWTP